MLGEASSGASSDLAGATDLATRMVREYGMSDAARSGRLRERLARCTSAPRRSAAATYAEATQRVIDEEVSALLREAEQRATALLTEHRDALDRLVEDLLAHETVDGTPCDAAIRGEGRPDRARPRAAARCPRCSTRLGTMSRGRPRHRAG